MSTFEKVRHSDQRLYGPRKLLLCGFPAVSQSKFRALLEMLAIGNLPLVWITADQAEVPIQEALSLADGTGAQSDSDMERAIVVSGISQNELHQLMTGCRQAGMQNALWAALTPTSEKWSVGQLIAELKAERAAMAGQRGTGETKPQNPQKTV
jgi:hypothetical protein